MIKWDDMKSSLSQIQPIGTKSWSIGVQAVSLRVKVGICSVSYGVTWGQHIFDSGFRN